MATEWRIVRAEVTGSWRSDRFTYARWEDWLPSIDLAKVDVDDARADLAHRYFADYGPGTVDDFRWWSGLTMAQAREATAVLDSSLRGAEQVVGLRLLPVWDALMVAYEDRSRLIDVDRLPFVYDLGGNATSVVISDGRVEGVWDLGTDDSDLEIRVGPFGTWSEKWWRSVESEAGRIAAMIGSVSVVRCSGPLSLHEGPRNRFLSPLKEARADR